MYRHQCYFNWELYHLTSILRHLMLDNINLRRLPRQKRRSVRNLIKQQQQQKHAIKFLMFITNFLYPICKWALDLQYCETDKCDRNHTVNLFIFTAMLSNFAAINYRESHSSLKVIANTEFITIQVLYSYKS